ncbi:transcriptional repressor [Peptostreptococcaceae bacterium OttesenSCG-928-C18]|nr:transcriptional repressor [Peptostreptococcaceae bacterium OttesenSCG-928-C18]
MEKLLKEHNLKITNTRLIILEELCKLNKSITAEELSKIVNKIKKTNLSTIYRNLKVLTEKNLVVKVAELNSETYFQLNTDKHIHHLICVNCKEILPLDTCPLHELENLLKTETGYEIISHSLEFRGLCPNCKEKTHLK